MHILRVAERPQTLLANTVYLIKNQDDLDILITGETAAVVAEAKSSGIVADARLPALMTGKTLNAGELQFMNQKLHDNEASYELSLANGNYQRFAPTANGSIVLSGFTSGKLGIMLVKGVGLGSRTITWPASVNWMKTDGTFTTVFAQTGVVLQTGSGVDFIQFWSDDGGSTIYAKVFR